MEAHTYCACCMQLQRARCERYKGFYVVHMPLLVHQHEPYEPQPLYYHHYQGLQAWRSRWLRRVEKEEEEIPEAPFQHRKKRVDSCRNSTGKGKESEKQERLLQTLIQRLEALEVGMKCLARVPNEGLPPLKPQGKRGGHCVARSNPVAECSLTHDAEAYQGVLKRGFSSEERSAMNREEATVVIQSWFQAYLVHRLQSLRDLKHLALLKMSLGELKAIFFVARFRRLMSRDADECNGFSKKATALLLEVDFVQGSDLLVREARRSLSKELVTLLGPLDRMGTQSKPSVQGREDFVVRTSSNCFDCSGEAPMPHSESLTEEEEEEFTQEANDQRSYASNRDRDRDRDRDHFTHTQ